MSLAGAVNSAVKQARMALGDVIVNATLREVNSVYDTTTGRYIDTDVDKSVEVAPDKFSFNELQDPGYQGTDVKLIVFNPNNDIDISINHKVIYLGMQFNIRKIQPESVGGYKPIYTVILKK